MARDIEALWETLEEALVRWDSDKGRYIFVKAPKGPKGAGLNVGDMMPENWGATKPHNSLALEERRTLACDA